MPSSSTSTRPSSTLTLVPLCTVESVCDSSNPEHDGVRIKTSVRINDSWWRSMHGIVILTKREDVALVGQRGVVAWLQHADDVPFVEGEYSNSFDTFYIMGVADKKESVFKHWTEEELVGAHIWRCINMPVFGENFSTEVDDGVSIGESSAPLLYATLLNVCIGITGVKRKRETISSEQKAVPSEPCDDEGSDFAKDARYTANVDKRHSD